MTDIFKETMDKILDLKKQQKELAASIDKASFSGLFTELFAKYPQVKAVQWTQYTPHFNDGESCEFGFGNLYVDIRKEDEDENFEDFECLDDADELYNALNDIDTKLRSMEDILLEKFDDHAQVTVYRDRIEVEEHDHD